MTRVVGHPIPGRAYPVGEEFEIVVDPFWEQRGKTRQVQLARVVSFESGLLLLDPFGQPRDDPKPAHAHCPTCDCWNPPTVAMHEPMHWTLADACTFVRAHQAAAFKAGYYITIAGGCINKGRGKDLDLVIVPRWEITTQSVTNMANLLIEQALKDVRRRDDVRLLKVRTGLHVTITLPDTRIVEFLVLANFKE